MPVYNCMSFIKTAVNSILLQTYRKIEIVLVDDGSTDGSSYICDDLQKNSGNIHVIHQNNMGVSAARNSGMKYVFSKNSENDIQNYIAFLDADDVWVSGFFNEYVIQLIERNYDLIGFQSAYANCNLTKRTVPVKLKTGTYYGGTSSVWLYGTQSFAAMLYNVAFLKKYNLFFPAVKYSEDKIFSMQCMYLADRICLENKLLYLYRQNRKSAMYKRKVGIPYYTPIIDAYLESDKKMLCWKNDKRGELHEGTVLARIYIMDMINEHYQRFGSSQQLENLLQDRPEYREILSSKLDTTPLIKGGVIMKSNLHKYKVICYIRGGLQFGLRIIKRNCIVQYLMDKKKYPVNLI